LPQHIFPLDKLFPESQETAEHFRLRNFNFPPGKNVRKQLFRASVKGKARKEAVQPPAPRVLVESRQIERPPVFRVDPPADLRVRHPVADEFQVLRPNRLFLRDGRVFQHRQNFAGGKAAEGQIQKRQKSPADDAFGKKAAVGDRVGNLGLARFKDRFDERGVGFDIRHHHQHVLRSQSRVFFKQRQ